MSDYRCRDCVHFTAGVTDQQRKEWSVTNFGMHADGVCHHYFPRGYLARKPPHPALSTGWCFELEPKDPNQIEITTE